MTHTLTRTHTHTCARTYTVFFSNFIRSSGRSLNEDISNSTLNSSTHTHTHKHTNTYTHVHTHVQTNTHIHKHKQDRVPKFYLKTYRWARFPRYRSLGMWLCRTLSRKTHTRHYTCKWLYSVQWCPCWRLMLRSSGLQKLTRSLE